MIKIYLKFNNGEKDLIYKFYALFNKENIKLKGGEKKDDN